MYYSTGYRLGLNLLSDELVKEGDMALGLMLEYKNNLIQLTSQQTMAYDLVFAKEKQDSNLIEQLNTICSLMKISELDIQNITEDLINQNVIANINTDDEFMDKLGSYKLVRQGSSVYSYDDFRKGILKPCIRQATIDSPISSLELELWRKCNGCKAIKELLNENFSNIDLYDYVYAIKNLKAKSALYII